LKKRTCSTTLKEEQELEYLAGDAIGSNGNEAPIGLGIGSPVTSAPTKQSQQVLELENELKQEE